METLSENPLRLTVRLVAVRVLLLITATYGILYYCYKYFSPTVLDGDSSYYYPIYVRPLDFHAAAAPFVLRQVGAVLTFLVWKAHLFYPDAIVNTNPAFDQHVFFAALVVNWACLVTTALLTGFVAERLAGRRDTTLFLIAAFLCVLSFHTQVAVVTDTAEGPAWLLMALAFLAYIRRSYVWLIVALSLAAFQRETILLAIGLIAALEIAPGARSRQFPAFALALSAFWFVIYLALRRHFGGGWEFQSHPADLLHGLVRAEYSRDLLFQGLLTQNVLFLALGTFIAARFRPAAVEYWLAKGVAAFVLIAVVSLAASEGNTTGRLAGILTPIFAACAALALQAQTQLDAKPERTSGPVSNRPSYAFIGAGLALLITTRVWGATHPKHKLPKHLPYPGMSAPREPRPSPTVDPGWNGGRN